MPGWLQPFAKYQPVTPMVNAVRALIVGSSSDVARPRGVQSVSAAGADGTTTYWRR